MKILKIAIPAIINLTVMKGEINIEDVPEIVLDLERQLNNLKLTLGKKEVQVGPRFHLSGNLTEYKFVSNGTISLKGRGPDSEDQG